MTDSTTPSSDIAVAGRGSDERPREDLIARLPAELRVAGRSHAEGVEELEQAFWTDPCHFLRRACQTADYGGDELRA